MCVYIDGPPYGTPDFVAFILTISALGTNFIILCCFSKYQAEAKDNGMCAVGHECGAVLHTFMGASHGAVQLTK